MKITVRLRRNRIFEFDEQSRVIGNGVDAGRVDVSSIGKGWCQDRGDECMVQSEPVSAWAVPGVFAAPWIQPAPSIDIAERFKPVEIFGCDERRPFLVDVVLAGIEIADQSCGLGSQCLCAFDDPLPARDLPSSRWEVDGRQGEIAYPDNQVPVLQPTFLGQDPIIECEGVSSGYQDAIAPFGCRRGDLMAQADFVESNPKGGSYRAIPVFRRDENVWGKRGDRLNDAMNSRPAAMSDIQRYDL